MRPFNTFIFIITFLLFVTPLSGARAEDDLHVTCHYFTPDPSGKSKYKEAAKWPIINLADWLKLKKSLESSLVDKGVIAFVPDGKEETFHIIKRNDDQITGVDYYITKGHITEIMTTSVDSYAVTTPKFREFLEKGLESRFTFDEKGANPITVNSPGLIVMYNGSNRLQNPMWRISDPKELSAYVSYIKK